MVAIAQWLEHYCVKQVVVFWFRSLVTLFKLCKEDLYNFSIFVNSEMKSFYKLSLQLMAVTSSLMPRRVSMMRVPGGLWWLQVAKL